MSERAIPKCGRCESRNVAEIVYGRPLPDADELFREVDEKRVILGGCCVIYGESPKWKCTECGYTWGEALSSEELDEE